MVGMSLLHGFKKAMPDCNSLCCFCMADCYSAWYTVILFLLIVIGSQIPCPLFLFTLQFLMADCVQGIHGMWL